uniref:Uncharacterized protein n=1 Tax=viral metagenome TaxID=1070528 RepID=A0A6C0I341_9ZZZZ
MDLTKDSVTLNCGKTMASTLPPPKCHGALFKKWSVDQPSDSERTVMLKQCGKSCFLGPKKSFPICTRNTCKRNKKGILAAYVRAREYMSMSNKDKYKHISKKAYDLLHPMSKNKTVRAPPKKGK